VSGLLFWYYTFPVSALLFAGALVQKKRNGKNKDLHCIIEKNGSAAIAAQDDVIECSRTVDSWLSSHVAMSHHKLQYCKLDPIIHTSKDI